MLKGEFKMSAPIQFILINTLHELFTVIWIGGLIILLIAILPSFRKQQTPQNKSLLDSIQKRLNIAVLVSIIGLWLTGIAMSNYNTTFEGFLSFTNTYTMIIAIKHIFVIIMTLIAVIRTLTIVRSKRIPEKTGLLLVIVNVIMGIIVLFLSAYSAAL